MPAMPRMNEKQRLILSVVVIIVGILGLGALWAWGLLKAGTLGEELEKNRQALAVAEKSLASLEEKQRKSRDRAELERRLLQRLPDQKELERVYDVLEEIERQAGQVAGGIAFTFREGKILEDKGKGKKAGPPQDFEEILLEVDSFGTWAGFVSFLDGVEHADRLIAVKSFTSSKDDNKDGMSSGFKVLLAVYVLKEPAPEKPKAPAAPAKPS